MSEARLLLVDDEDTFREQTAKELRHSGYEVTTASTLDEARRALATHDFHLVLLDLRLPDGNGLDLLTELRESAPSTEVDHPHGLRHGAGRRARDEARSPRFPDQAVQARR